MFDAVADSAYGWIASVGRVFSSMGVAAAAVPSCGGVSAIELTGVSVGCRRGSCAWTRGGGNAFGEVSNKELSGIGVGVTGASAFDSNEVMR